MLSETLLAVKPAEHRQSRMFAGIHLNRFDHQMVDWHMKQTLHVSIDMHEPFRMNNPSQQHQHKCGMADNG